MQYVPHAEEDRQLETIRTKLYADRFLSRLGHEEGEVYHPNYAEHKANETYYHRTPEYFPEPSAPHIDAPISLGYHHHAPSRDSDRSLARDHSPVRGKHPAASKVKYTICVRDWKHNMTTEEFVELFSVYGPIDVVAKYKGHQRRATWAFVRYKLSINSTYFRNLRHRDGMTVCNLQGDLLRVNYAKKDWDRRSNDQPYRYIRCGAETVEVTYYYSK